MASEKTELKKHLNYLEARRSGAEAALNILQDEPDDPIQAIKDFIQKTSHSVQDTAAKIAKIEEAERAEKERKAAEKRNRPKPGGIYG